MDLLSMRWRDGLFAHWPVDPSTVESHLPDGLDVATYDGEAWLGIVGFVMEDIRPTGLPVGRTFPEVNLRTYVTRDGESGVYFFSLDADDRLSVSLARSVYALPYYRARMDVERVDDGLRLRSERTHPGEPRARLDVSYRADGESAVPDPGSLPAFLVENYRFYTRGRRLYRGDISHDPWRLAPGAATLHEESLFRAAGFEPPSTEPLVHVAEPLDVTAAALTPVDD
jgi:uncharacterized protein YqjF (DUF2071 family)